jgi:hypothetical protein
MVERGHVAVVDALEAEEPDQLWRQLEVAERRFGEAAETEDERMDATFMAAIVRALRSFGLGGSADVAASAAAEAREALRERGLYGRPEALPILSRRASEAAWMRLVDRLEQLAPELDQPLWVRGAEVVNLLLEAIELSRAVRLAPGAELDVSAAVVPRIEAPLVRNLDQRRMLAQVLAREQLPDKRRQAAAELLERVGEIPKGGGPEDPLEAVLGADEAGRAAQMFDAGTLGRLRSAIFVRPARDAQWTERYDRILGDLDGSPDFASELRVQIEALIADLLDFLSLCLRYELKFASGSLAYLGKPNAVEQQMADHLVMFLERNWTVHTEVRHEGGGGRVDVRVALGPDRFIIECKRDQQPAAAGALDPYLAQADRYLATSLRIAGLAVLDLSDKKTGAVRGLDQSVWVADMPPADPAAPTRKIISLIVPGNRPSTPSAVGKATARSS